MRKQLAVPDHLVPALERMLAISIKKRNDYSRTGPWANFKDTSEFFGLQDWQSAIFNIVQKLSRVRSLSYGREIMNEPLEDTLLDLANYALFAYAMYLELSDPQAVNHDSEPRLEDGHWTCCGAPEMAIHRSDCPRNYPFTCCGGELGSHMSDCKER